MQKFTRPLTREIELAGERLALTFDDQGISVRPVGSRKPPRSLSWAHLLCSLTEMGKPVTETPTAEELAEALKRLKTTAPPAPSPEPASAPEPAPTAQPPAAAAPTPAASVPSLLARLECWLAMHRPHFLQGLMPTAGAADLDALQSSLGISLPSEVRALLAWRNGQGEEMLGSFENGWNFLSTWQIAAATQELRTEGLASGWQPTWVPILENDAGNYLFLDASQPNSPLREFQRGRPGQPTEAASLTAWLEDFVNAVERGGYRVDKERGTFVRQG